MDTQLQLGDFIFKDFEIPEKINFGGSQQLIQHDLIGGGRVIDALGKNDIDITWTGLIFGEDALLRAQTLNKMRADGKKIRLKWFNLNYDVIIQNFEAQTEKFFQITYTINVRVILDGTNPNSAQNIIGFNEAVKNDYKTANTISLSVNNPSIMESMNTLGVAIDAVPTFNGASQAEISTVITPLNNTKSAISSVLQDLKIALFGDQSGNII